MKDHCENSTEGIRAREGDFLRLMKINWENCEDSLLQNTTICRRILDSFEHEEASWRLHWRYPHKWRCLLIFWRFIVNAYESQTKNDELRISWKLQKSTCERETRILFLLYKSSTQLLQNHSAKFQHNPSHRTVFCILPSRQCNHARTRLLVRCNTLFTSYCLLPPPFPTGHPSMDSYAY